MVVCDGRRADVVVDAVAGKPVGTLFAGGEAAVKGKKLWLAYAGHPKGSVTIDDGAKVALCLRRREPAPGRCRRRDRELCRRRRRLGRRPRMGTVVARGLAGMSAEDLRKVRGLKTSEIARRAAGSGTARRSSIATIS